jgi:hypothetical protein
MISSEPSAVSYIPLKNCSAASWRLLVTTVAPSPTSAAGQSAADRCSRSSRRSFHVADLPIADALGERGKRGKDLLHLVGRSNFRVGPS